MSLRSAFLQTFGQSIQRVFDDLNLSFSLADSSGSGKSLADSKGMIDRKDASSDGSDHSSGKQGGDTGSVEDKDGSVVGEWTEDDDMETYKLVLLGSGGAGKSALLQQVGMQLLTHCLFLDIGLDMCIPLFCVFYLILLSYSIMAVSSSLVIHSLRSMIQPSKITTMSPLRWMGSLVDS